MFWLAGCLASVNQVLCSTSIVILRNLYCTFQIPLFVYHHFKSFDCIVGCYSNKWWSKKVLVKLILDSLVLRLYGFPLVSLWLKWSFHEFVHDHMLGLPDCWSTLSSEVWTLGCGAWLPNYAGFGRAWLTAVQRFRSIVQLLQVRSSQCKSRTPDVFSTAL